jgi:hypothetical protein
VDPLARPECGGQMKVVAFIEPPQGDLPRLLETHRGQWVGTIIRDSSPSISELSVFPATQAEKSGNLAERNSTKHNTTNSTPRNAAACA